MKADDRWIWLFAGVMVILPLMFVASSVEPYVCGLKIVASEIEKGNAANCFEFWVNRYQTMVSGVTALSAAFVAYLAAKAQIRHAESLEESRRQTEEYAARATLPLALSEVCDYALACFDIFKSRLPNYNDRSPLELPVFPRSAVEPLQYCIRFSDKSQAKKIADLLSNLQIFHSRVAGKSRWRKAMLYERILDAVILNIRASDLFDYGRRGEEGWMKRPDPARIGRELRINGFSSDQHPMLFAFVGPESIQTEPELHPIFADDEDDDGHDIVWSTKHP